VVAAVNIALYMTTFLLYFFGKRIRIWIAKCDMLGKSGLR
jgi:hypothetical protein